MRKNPKRCKLCGEYMEPDFDDKYNIWRSFAGAKLDNSPLVKAARWICINDRCKSNEVTADEN